MREPAGHDSPDRSDQLSPNRALHDSTGATASQRSGNNGPVGNPTVSFPEPSAEAEPASEQSGPA
jgi:hypothetical protein